MIYLDWIDLWHAFGGFIWLLFDIGYPAHNVVPSHGPDLKSRENKKENKGRCICFLFVVDCWCDVLSSWLDFCALMDNNMEF